ncbi:MAG: SAM-dependent methyltransferase [Akkermansiaceae bacterium]|nr:SAM-dependent methyltransferase [Akkermansia sp.]MCD7797803.1 SAM-dependent methyltransferase [Akkermansiaceae bacterium]
MNLSRHILAAGGWISMERFMELALYEDGEGYYSASAAAIGARGDFSTSATLSPLLARALLARWEEACTRFGRRLPLLEVGGGDGSLASAIGRELGFLQRLRTRYLMVDRSRVLRGVQRLCAGNFARVYSTMDAALKRAGGAAFIFSNELPDAFPARRFLFRGGEWLELGVSFENASCAETPRPCPSLPESSAFAFWRREGQIVEVHESYARWYRGWQPQWKEGVHITIDYGGEAESLYRRRPRGTMRGYKGHRRLELEQVFPLAGHCDITCDVNFTDLLRLARSCAGDRAELVPQRGFLLPFADRRSAADAFLVDEAGAGSHFLVLVQERTA